MKRCLVLLCAALLMCLCGCGSGANVPREGTLHLYYPTGTDAPRGGDIIDSVAVNWEQQEEKDAQQQVRQAVELLLSGDPMQGRSPIPQDTRLQDCSVKGGLACLDFSENYGQLSGMELSVADYCITLTLSQIPKVYMVRITVDGQELAYRDKNTFVSDDVLLTSAEDVVRTLEAQLYFLDDSHALKPEKRLLTLYEGENQAEIVLNALMDGPKSEELLPLLPENFAPRAVRQEEGICYVNLTKEDESLLPESEAEQTLLLQGMVKTLHSLEGVEQVQFLCDNELQPEFGLMDISRPFR